MLKLSHHFLIPPIVIGHSFGGLIAQVILGRGIAAAGVAIDPAPIKGVWQLPFFSTSGILPGIGQSIQFQKSCLVYF